MRRWALLAPIGVVMLTALPAEAQLGGRLTIEPYVGYGFFGSLPETSGELEADLSIGGRVGFHLAPQWAVFANAQRSSPEVTGTLGGVDVEDGELTVDHFSAGVEFSYVPRGGAEGMLPILLEAGIGQTRYDGGANDTAVNLGIASALRLSSNFAIRYGANDYISNYRGGDGIVNHVVVRVGAEVSL
jgi:hypothetical protein